MLSDISKLPDSPVSYFSITGMKCGACVKAIEKHLEGTPGTLATSVNFAERTLMIHGKINSEMVVAKLAKAGYKAVPLSAEENTPETSQTAEDHYHRQLLYKTLVAGSLGVPLLLISNFTQWIPPITSMPGRLSWFIISLLTLFILYYSAGHFYRGAWKAIQAHSANMDTLIALGTAAAWLYSTTVVFIPHIMPAIGQHLYFESAVLIVAFVNLGAFLENYARGKTSQAIKSLMGLQPKTARLVHNNEEKDVPIEFIKLGHIVRIRPGERIPVDGIVLSGHSNVDESMISGEPLPIKKQQGDKLIAGTQNKTGSLLLEAQQVGKGTMLAQIIAQVRHAQNTKPPIGRLADTISAYFVPAILMLAILTALVWLNIGPNPAYSLITAMTVLIIACPCALGLGTPMSIMVGIGKAAETGILIRNGDALQYFRKIKTICLDKTGTITRGTPEVITLDPYHNWDEAQLLQKAASIEAASEHPLADAILATAKCLELKLTPVEGFKAIAGHGVIGFLDGKKTLLGNEKLMNKYRVDLQSLKQQAQHYSEQGQTPVYLAQDEQPIGIIVIADPIKPSAKDAIKRLHKQGLKVVMLTGDNAATAKSVAKQVGIDKVYPDVLPQDKLDYINMLQSRGEVVAMAGDGINDAAALAKAHIGIAMGQGTDIAMESADVTLMSNNLHSIPDAIAISRATVRNIHQNLFGAFIYNVLGIPIAAGALFPFTGHLLNPAVAGAAMALSSLTVVTNANRLRYVKALSRK